MKINQESPDLLIAKLSDTSDSTSWYRNALKVGQFGVQAESAVPELLRALNHTEGIIQAHALVVLGMIKSQPEKCMPALVPFLSSPDLGFRQKAIGALAAFETNAFPAKVAIQGALSDSDAMVWGELNGSSSDFQRSEGLTHSRRGSERALGIGLGEYGLLLGQFCNHCEPPDV